MRRAWRVALLTLAGCTPTPPAPSQPAPVKVRCVVVAPQTFDEELALPGRVEPAPGADLAVASQVQGRIVELMVHEGERVTRGQTVALVDDASSRDAMRQAEAALAQQRAAYSNATTVLGRVTALVARGIAARQELDDARTRAESERQGVRSAQAAVDMAQRTLSRVAVKSTLAGVITRVWRGPGSLVDGTSATPIAQVAGSASADFAVAATARELQRLQVGQAARIELEGSSMPIDGPVRALSSAIDPVTGLGGARISLSEVDGGVLIGAYGRARIVTQHRENVSAIPSSAIRGALSDGAEVVVCNAGKADVRAVNVGYRNAQFVEVLAGVKVGEKVATDHVIGLAAGTEIEESD